MIEISNVSKSFRRKSALINVSLKIAKGTITGLLGPNGAGKTTLIRLMNIMLVPDEGYLKYDGQLLKKDHLKNIGYLPEERGLYPDMTVNEQLNFFAKLRGLSREEASLNAKYWIEKLKMSEWSHETIQSLSKGMAQKVQFAVAVVHDPEFIILDEPLTGFDPINVDLIKNLLFEFKEAGKTVLLSTHNMHRVQDMCSHVILLNEGRIVSNCSIKELLDGYESDRFVVRYRGTSIAFANALWTDFELLEQIEIQEGLIEAHLLKRGDKSVDDLIRNLQGHVTIDSVYREQPQMDHIFLDLIEKGNIE
ncbi:MAG: ATP-binding cassette domain-containing protein [Crocinitomicaceae bacterium]|jgi:ABC-2 type transport system ATP-binding protein|tara:strand:+ start:23790 stop:24710 length:921 start_codon:yes stop_codon:yes gene_type:complete